MIWSPSLRFSILWLASNGEEARANYKENPDFDFCNFAPSGPIFKIQKANALEFNSKQL